MNPKGNLNLGNIDGTSVLKPNVDEVKNVPNIENNDKLNNIIDANDAFNKENNGEQKNVDLTGKKVNENGNVEDSATKKTVKAIGRGAAAYFSGGKSLQYDQQVTNNRVGDKLIGVVSDELDKVPGVEKLAEGLDELNVADTANAAMDTVGNAMNGDVAGAVKSGAKTVKEAGKTVKNTEKAILSKVIIIVGPALIFFVIMIAILSPNSGGFIDLTNEGVTDNSSSGGSSSKPGPEDDGNYVDASAVSNMDIQITESQIDYLKTSIPSWSTLNSFQKNIILASYSAIGKIDYNWGGKPTSAGVQGIGSGLDCSGFVSWAIWTASGKPFNQSTDVMSSQMGSNGLKTIQKSELLPGDIVVMRRPNNTGHALIYAGNSQYIHLSGKGQKVKMSGYTFNPENTVYYGRYVG